MCYAVSLIKGQTILRSPIYHQTVVNYIMTVYQLLCNQQLLLDSKQDYILVILSALQTYECIPN